MSASAEEEEDAFIAIKQGVYFHGIWFVPIPRGDWMGALYKNDGEELWHFDHRFRYYKSEKVFDSGDTKNLYRSTATGTPGAIVGTIRSVAEKIARMAGTKVEFVDLQCDGGSERAFQQMSKASFVHIKMNRVH